MYADLNEFSIWYIFIPQEEDEEPGWVRYNDTFSFQKTKEITKNW